MRIDVQQLWRELEETYSQMADEEFESLASQAYELTDIARQVLQRQITSRGLKLGFATESPALDVVAGNGPAATSTPPNCRWITAPKCGAPTRPASSWTPCTKQAFRPISGPTWSRTSKTFLPTSKRASRFSCAMWISNAPMPRFEMSIGLQTTELTTSLRLRYPAAQGAVQRKSSSSHSSALRAKRTTTLSSTGTATPAARTGKMMA